MTLRSRFGQLLRRAAPPAAPAAIEARPAERWDDQFPGGVPTMTAWLARRRDAGRLYADLPRERVAALAQRFPRLADRTVAAAERVVRHEFDLLGSGPRVPVDPDRAIGPDGYRPIDWQLDLVSGLRFPGGFPHQTWTPQMRPGLADIKLPWEMGRCQHWMPLAQAFLLTGDERFAMEIIRQHADFLDANPVGIGVQYVCTMDVAIRAFNWALAFALIRESQSLDAAMARVHRSLFEQGAFIEEHLENTYEVTSNHFLSNVVGLYGVAVVFADLPAGERWARRCRAWLEQEMRVQVLADGADYESSVPYHRLVTELFLAGAALAAREGAPLSRAYVDRLRQMCEFAFAVRRPDGLLPQIGDADDGRVHVFTDYGTWKPQDARHLAGPAAAVLGDMQWLHEGGDEARWEAAWWGGDSDARPPAEAGATGAAHLFRDAGIAVVTAARAYLVVTNGRVGTNGFGNHKHNDLLAFEFHADGVPLFVDPGSYVYTSDPDARNLFRSTAYHNTVVVDGVEQNDLKPEYLFRLFEASTVEHLAFDDAPEAAHYRGRHTGYTRLPHPVTHERMLRVEKAHGALRVSDRFHGSGNHQLTWHFHLAPGVDAVAAGSANVLLKAAGRRFRFDVPDGLRLTIADAWYSPSYGVRQPCRAIALTAGVDVAIDRVFEFRCGPEEGQAS